MRFELQLIDSISSLLWSTCKVNLTDLCLLKTWLNLYWINYHPIHIWATWNPKRKRIPLNYSLRWLDSRSRQYLTLRNTPKSNRNKVYFHICNTTNSSSSSNNSYNQNSIALHFNWSTSCICCHLWYPRSQVIHRMLSVDSRTKISMFQQLPKGIYIETAM